MYPITAMLVAYLVLFSIGLTTSTNISISSLVHQNKKNQAIEILGGFILYTIVFGDVKYLLLKNTADNEWNFANGKKEEYESIYEAGVRETKEETGWLAGNDFQPDLKYRVDLTYETEDDILRKVYLWAGRMGQFHNPIQLSEEHTEFTWLEYDEALKTINKYYEDALVKGHIVIRTLLGYPTHHIDNYSKKT